MSTWSQPLLACALLAGLALGFGCGSGISSPPARDDDAPPLLQPGHTGWKHPHCSDCHELPVEDHFATHAPDCAVCHGGNGACDPNGVYSLRQHLAGEACTSCHVDQHGYTADVDCATCHFAGEGLDDTCGEPPPDPADGLRPATELSSGCFGWPETAFTRENFALEQLGLQPGAAAVDFTLRTPGGASVRLADLLASRPVVLVMGAFT